jgi:hypothetical protein
MRKKIKKILLAGLGAEIGSMLLSLNNPGKDNLFIDTVITRPILTGKNYTQLESLYARLVLNDPAISPFLEIGLVITESINKLSFPGLFSERSIDPISAPRPANKIFLIFFLIFTNS